MKQVILVRQDLKMGRGKLSAQVAHASVESVSRSDDDVMNEWRKEGMKKVVLKVKDEKELLKYNQMAKDEGLITALITDAGKTEFNGVPTKTCVAIGPDKDKKIDEITGKLKML